MRQVREEQNGFRKGRSCADQMFVLRQVSEKMIEKMRRLSVAFMGLEKADDKVDRLAVAGDEDEPNRKAFG